ncbi:hypothetical protein ALC57_04669, partial [Trachymyrmex cornetzi]
LNILQQSENSYKFSFNEPLFSMQNSVCKIELKPLIFNIDIQRNVLNRENIFRWLEETFFKPLQYPETRDISQRAGGCVLIYDKVFTSNRPIYLKPHNSRYLKMLDDDIKDLSNTAWVP